MLRILFFLVFDLSSSWTVRHLIEQKVNEILSGVSKRRSRTTRYRAEETRFYTDKRNNHYRPTRYFGEYQRVKNVFSLFFFFFCELERITTKPNALACDLSGYPVSDRYTYNKIITRYRTLCNVPV